MKTTEQQIREHVRRVIKEIKQENINEGEIERMAARAANRTRMIDGSGRAAMYGGRAAAGTIAVPAAVAANVFVTAAFTIGAIQHGIYAYNARGDAHELANKNMARSSIVTSWNNTIIRRRALGEKISEGRFQTHVQVMRDFTAKRDFDADTFAEAISYISKEDWEPIEADASTDNDQGRGTSFGDIEDAQEVLNTMIGDAPERALHSDYFEKQWSESQQQVESRHLSEARKHVRNAINEIMVGLTPIRRIDTQGNANKARKGNNTNTAVNKADIGFNTFDMQEWASIAGIDERHLTESVSDDTGNDSMLGGDDESFDNVVDIADRRFDSSDEIVGMEDEDNRHDSAPYEAEGELDAMLTRFKKEYLQFKANKRGSDVDDMENEVEDLADQLLADREDPGVVNLADESDLSTVFDFDEFKA